MYALLLSADNPGARMNPPVYPVRTFCPQGQAPAPAAGTSPQRSSTRPECETRGVQLQAPVSARAGALRRAADPQALRQAAWRSARRLRDEPATQVAWQALWPSRLIVLLAGVAGVVS